MQAEKLSYHTLLLCFEDWNHTLADRQRCSGGVTTLSLTIVIMFAENYKKNNVFKNSAHTVAYSASRPSTMDCVSVSCYIVKILAHKLSVLYRFRK